MLEPSGVEIAIAAVVQIGAFLILFGGMRTELKNIKEWLTSTARDARQAKEKTAVLKQRLDDLPCKTCKPGGN